MPLASNFNAVFTIDRLTRSGTEDGTPVYTESVVVVAGWFDELETRTIEEPFRGSNDPISYADRRALFMCLTNADIQQDDVGTVVMTGSVDRGKWQVSLVRAAPTPLGPGHLEVQLQGPTESK